MQKPSLSDESLLTGLFGAQVAAELQVEEAEKKAAIEAARDRIAERLVADGFFPNEYHVEHDGSFATWRTEREYAYPWNLPSRLFKFPAHTDLGPDGVRRIGLLHPLLIDHPLVKEIIAKGYDICSAEECVNECDVPLSHISHGEWWHAVDLIERNYRELLNTRQFTTTNDIAAAVCYRCSYPHAKGPLTTIVREMREVLEAIEITEPDDSSVGVLASFSKPYANHGEGKKAKARWTVCSNRALKTQESGAIAWAYIHGIERGWFENVGGYLGWTAKGREHWAELNPLDEEERIEADAMEESTHAQA